MSAAAASADEAPPKRREAAMSLRARINLIVALLTLLFVAAVLLLELRAARDSVREETVAANRVAAQLLNSTVLRYAAQGIRINAVCPGAIHTPMVEAVAQEEEAARFIAAMHPMNRIGEAQEVADAVVFLCSDKASFITGHPLAVDGGYMAR